MHPTKTVYTTDYCQKLLQKRKLVLICDLDETLISTFSLQSISLKNNKQDHINFDFCRKGLMYHYYLKERPYLQNFLWRMSRMFELHVMSLGLKEYVDECLKIIDPDQRYFGGRTITREDVANGFDKAKTQESLYPQCENMIISIDDRTDVWGNCSSVVHVKPFTYFSPVRQILKTSTNDEPGLLKNVKQQLNNLNTDDNYLLVLQDIFEHIHKKFFDRLEKLRFNSANNEIIPDVRKFLKKKKYISMKDHVDKYAKCHAIPYSLHAIKSQNERENKATQNDASIEGFWNNVANNVEGSLKGMYRRLKSVSKMEIKDLR